jgi:hypothetical protein
MARASRVKAAAERAGAALAEYRERELLYEMGVLKPAKNIEFKLGKPIEFSPGPVDLPLIEVYGAVRIRRGSRWTGPSSTAEL